MEIPMKRFRLSVAALMGVVLLLALGMAALRANTDIWASAMFTAAVSLFSVAIIAAMAIRGSARFTWMGMAVFGWIYLVISFGPWPGSTTEPPPLITSVLLDYVQDYILTTNKIPYLYTAPVNPHPFLEKLGGLPGAAPPPGGYRNIGSISPYLQTGQCLGGMLFGIMGAVAGRLISARRGQIETA
jgi:hypothetical protein